MTYVRTDGIEAGRSPDDYGVAEDSTVRGSDGRAVNGTGYQQGRRAVSPEHACRSFATTLMATIRERTSVHFVYIIRA